MALIVENGTGLADAESYISVADATAHHAARGNAAWAALATDTIREQLLRKATDYMVQVYRLRWAGYRTSTTQALDWPRYWVPVPDAVSGYTGLGGPSYPSDEVPLAVARACAELALKANSGALIPDATQAVKREKVFGVEIEYQDYSQATKTYRAIDNALSPFMSGQGSIRLFRA